MPEFDFIGQSLKRGHLAVVSQLRLKPFTYATLPTSPALGTFAFITDASTSVIGSVVAGGGSDDVIIRYDGTNWLIFGGGTSLTGYGDLTALEAMAGTGLVTRTASETYAQRTITGTANRLDITNGNGVSGNPTLDISTSYVGQATITTLGTIATGTWQGTKVNLTYGGTNADLSATGGTSQFLKQSSVGATITVGQPTFADIASGSTSATATGLIVSGGRLTGSTTITSGANARAGNATLVAGTITVNNTTVTANTLITLTRKTAGGTIGTAITYTVSDGVSFTINSDNPLDTSTFSYILFELN